MRNKPNWNSSRTSILDTLVSQKRLHKPKTSTSMLWIGGGKSGVAFPSSYVMAMIQHIITSFIILIYILHPCAASLKSHNSEESSQFSTITHQSNVSRYSFKDIFLLIKQEKNFLSSISLNIVVLIHSSLCLNSYVYPVYIPVVTFNTLNKKHFNLN